MSTSDLEEQIRRVVSDLREETTIPGQYGLPASVHQRMAQTCTPALSVGVIDNFELAWTRAFGTLAAGAEPATANTPFQSGSISKPVFALAVMKLVEIGIIDLDTDVNDYLKSWQLPGRDGWQPRITLRQLLSHTAGTTIHGFPGYPASGPWPTAPQVLHGVPPANTQPVVVDILPGTQHHYSGGGTTIAQQLVVDVTGTPFPELMRNLILEPVGLTDSSFEQPPPSAFAKRAARGHPLNGTEIEGGHHVYPEMAAAGLWTTAADLTALGVEMMRSLRGDVSKLGLAPETVSSMLRPQLPAQEIGQEFVGLGWFCAGKDQNFRFFHHGWDHGYVATMLMLPAIGKGAVVMLNSNQGSMLRGEIISAVGREYGWPVLQDIPEISEVVPDVAYAGTYESVNRKIGVAQQSNRLLIEFADQRALAVYPAVAGDFVARALNLRLRFAGDDTARPSELTVVTGNKTELFKRTN
ncbi:beta-lactamase family protein [Bradyrhizobium huanghuaihaiense]|uniref:serine hydrolase domain-containing protein n=1 Tax=Bradyrhizobium huanghuaihaiense TaxID=990078 RepID=UPI0021A998F2|nr:serine hydrolase domain-containing protein [Bradyrhizobium sp. CB3035]UWU73331.1 beta-lactamase family protein [Bradyrhizobium sp. CB3035]